MKSLSSLSRAFACICVAAATGVTGIAAALLAAPSVQPAALAVTAISGAHGGRYRDFPTTMRQGLFDRRKVVDPTYRGPERRKNRDGGEAGDDRPAKAA
jgi:hypothetical protein